MPLGGYRVKKLEKMSKTCRQLRDISIDFQKSFTARLSTKWATKLALYIPSYLKDVAALPCETVMFQKSHTFHNRVLVFVNDLCKCCNDVSY